MFKATNAEIASDLTKPYRIMISLLDRSEIGIPAIQLLIMDIFMSFYENYHATSFQQEVR